MKEERYNYQEEKKDLAEEELFKRLGKGDWRAVKYILSTLGRDRGYVERQEITEVGEQKKQVFKLGDCVIEF